MIFRPESAQKIIDGSKTVTRRRAGSVCKYRVGQDYSVQPGRGKHEVARILVTSIRREPLADVRYPGETEREGFGGNLAEFERVWEELHGTWDERAIVDRIEFKLVRA